MDTPIVLYFYIKPSSTSVILRSIILKEYFRKLTTNVEVLYPTQVHNGLLLCKSKRTEEKILNMRHVLSDGTILHLSELPRQLFQQMKCLVDSQLMQSNEISRLLQQSIPFLHASGGKMQVNPDGSVVLEGHIFVLNSIHSFLGNKSSKQKHLNTSEPLDLRSRSLTIKIMNGKLIEQNVEGILIPMNDKYKIHKEFDRQIQTLGGTNFLNYFKELTTKGTRAHEGEIVLYPNRELKIPAKIFIIFAVPRLANVETTKDKSIIDAYQPTYEQMIYRTLQTIDQKSITSLALPLLEPNVKSSKERRYANEMTVRAMLSAIRQFSRSLPMKLKRILIIDHLVRIKRINKRVKQYQNQIQTKTTSNNNNNNIDLDIDDGQSFTNIFGVPKLPEIVSTTSESEDDIESEELELPYTDHAKS